MPKLNAKQLIAAQMLASGSLCKEAAEKVSVTPETISHWRKNAEFVAHYNACRIEQRDVAIAQLQSLSEEAVKALRALLVTAKSEETRRRAAINVLQLNGHGDLERLYTQIGSADATYLRRHNGLT